MAAADQGAYHHIAEHSAGGLGVYAVSKGGLGGFYRVFGEKYQEILDEMNEELVA